MVVTSPMVFSFASALALYSTWTRRAPRCTPQPKVFSPPPARTIWPRIVDQQLHGLAVGGLDHHARLAAQAVQPFEHAVDLGVAVQLIHPDGVLGRRRAVGIQFLPGFLLGGMNGGVALRLDALDVLLAFVIDAFALGGFVIGALAFHLQPHLMDARALLVVGGGSLGAAPRPSAPRGNSSRPISVRASACQYRCCAHPGWRLS